MIAWLWAAGVVQVALIAGNCLLPAKIRCRENLKRVSPLIAQVFIVHWAYIVLILAAFASFSSTWRAATWPYFSGKSSPADLAAP